MTNDNTTKNNGLDTDKNLLSILEDRFDWNLIFIAATWIFLLATVFMIFI